MNYLGCLLQFDKKVINVSKMPLKGVLEPKFYLIKMRGGGMVFDFETLYLPVFLWFVLQISLVLYVETVKN